jgi:zinc/manganese transport system substrate-binding protein
MVPILTHRIHRMQSVALSLAALLAVVAGCGAGASATGSGGKKTIVVTYSILGSLVSEAVGNLAKVVVMIPNGSDPHEWEPSARDIEQLNRADLIVRNGLGLEGGMGDALDRADKQGVATFVASDHVTVRTVGEGEGLPTGDPDQAIGAQDPHLWMDPLTMRDVMRALGPVLAEHGINASKGIATVIDGLGRLDQTVSAILAVVPEAERKLVTGHESLGYFAQRYGFKLVGALIPSLTTQADVSAQQLSQLAGKIRDERVKAIFTEMGTPPQVAEAIGAETGVKVIDLGTHNLPSDGKYSTFLIGNAKKIAEGLA